MSIPEGVRYCARAAAHAPSADNTQPWQLIWDGERLALYPRKAAPGTSGFPMHHPAVQLALGAAAENLMQAATGLEWAEPILRLEAESSDPIAEIRIVGSATPPAIEAALFTRHTNRFSYKRDRLPAPLLEWIRNQSEGDARVLVLDQPQRIKALAELTRRASEVRFQTREIHEWLAASFRMTPAEVARGDGLDIATLDLPPGGGWLLRFISDWRRMALLNRLGAYKAFARLEAKPMAEAPALFAIIGKPGAASARAAGRLMQRVWIELNQQGLAAQPGYVIPDQLQRLAQGQVPMQFASAIAQVERELGDILALTDQTLHMLLRIGLPTRVVKRSLRLPLEQILSIGSKLS